MFLKKILALNRTLLFRLTLLYAGIFCASSLLVLSVFYYKIHSVTMVNRDSELLEEVEEYISEMSENGTEGVKLKIIEAMETEDPDEEFVRLITRDGNEIVSTDTSSWGDVNDSRSSRGTRTETADRTFQTLKIPGREYEARMVSVVIGHDLVLQIGHTFEDAENYLQIFRNWFMLLLFPVTVGAAIIGWFMAKRALLDVEDVTRTAHEISKGAYDRRVRGQGRFDEINRLSETFNTMLDRIESLLKTMKEANDNIAHELRSPVARIRGMAEMNIMNQSIGEEFRNASASIIEECDNLIEITDSMLEMTETESGVSALTMEETDLPKLVSEACELFLPLADEKHISLEVNLPETLRLQSDRRKLQRVVSNLLENAIKFTPEGGTVKVSVRLARAEALINIGDTGIGISDSDIPHIFERFYRCDRSRSEAGAGLGLSLAKVFAEALNGTISVTSAVGRGSVFTVSLPL